MIHVSNNRSLARRCMDCYEYTSGNGMAEIEIGKQTGTPHTLILCLSCTESLVRGIDAIFEISACRHVNGSPLKYDDED